MKAKVWREVQTQWSGRLGPSKAAIFKPAGKAQAAPVNGVKPLTEAPAYVGWWVVKYPTARKPFMSHFTDAELREMEGLQEDGLAFYPWIPIRHP